MVSVRTETLSHNALDSLEVPAPSIFGPLNTTQSSEGLGQP